MCTLCQSTNPEQPYDFHFPSTDSTDYSLETSDGNSLNTSWEDVFDNIWASQNDANTDGELEYNANDIELSGSGSSGSSNGLPTYSTDQIADYLTHGYWEDTGRSARSFDLDEDRVLTFDVSKLDATGATTARKALDAWADVSGIVFEEVGNEALVYNGTTRYEAADIANGFSTTTTMGVGDTYRGSIGYSADEDYIKITLEAGKSYDILLNDAGVSGAVSDTRLSVYDSNGNRVAYNDDISGNDYHSRVNFTAETDGTYYLVADASGSRTGNYSLKVAEGTSDEPADIRFDDASGGAFASSLTFGGEIIYSSVNINSSWQDYGQYYLQTYIHEIGHALGLGHSGNYNGSASFSTSAHYANDSWQMTSMSYFSNAANTNVDASNVYVRGPMLADVAAIQNLYGGEADLRSGNTTYGNGATDNSFNFNDSRSFVIADGGGIDTIDLSHRSNNQYINLKPGVFGHLNGAYGNFAIAAGTVIENLITGSGADLVVGNAANNVISTGAGNDRIFASDGDDLIDSGGGADEVNGGSGTDTVSYGNSTTNGFSVIYNAFASQSKTLIIEDANGIRDTINNVELLQFYNSQTISVADVFANLETLHGEIASGSSESYKVSLDELLDTPSTHEEPVNNTPEAKDDAKTIVAGTSTTIDVLANDHDTDGDFLSIVGIDTSSTKGTVSINDDGTITYDAADAYKTLYEGQSATDSFRYSISDGNGGTAVATATITISGSGLPPVEVSPSMEVGQTNIRQYDANYWEKVSFTETIEDAVVVMGPATFNGSHGLTVRVRNITDEGFEFQVDEWEYLDGRHMTETISWMAGSKGSHIMADGTQITFGDTSTSSGSVDLNGFDGVPVVMGTLTGDSDGMALTHRLNSLSDNGFDFGIYHEEGLRNSNITPDSEYLQWVAIDASQTSNLYKSGNLQVNHDATSIGLLGAGDGFFADIQSKNGGDTASLRYIEENGDHKIFVHEETSRDEELYHVPEQVSWLSIDTGLYDLG